jgi:hypothetical protein
MSTQLLAIKESVLRELIDSHSVNSICAVGQAGGFAIAIRYSDVERLLANSRGDVRLFSLSSAARFLQDLGFEKFEVNTSEFEPGRIRKARPDRSEAMKRTRTKMQQPSLL